MAFVRVKRFGNRLYYYKVKTVYPQGNDKPRQKVLEYYGIHPPKGPQKGLRG